MRNRRIYYVFLVRTFLLLIKNESVSNKMAAKMKKLKRTNYLRILCTIPLCGLRVYKCSVNHTTIPPYHHTTAEVQGTTSIMYVLCGIPENVPFKECLRFPVDYHV